VFSCLTERSSTNGHTTKWCRTWQLATPGKLGSTSSPTAPRFPPGFAPKQSLLSFCCYLLLLLKPPRPMPPAQKEGEDGALPGLLSSSPPKHLQGLGPWPKPSKEGTEDGDSMSLQTRSSILPCLSAGFACLLF